MPKASPKKVSKGQTNLFGFFSKKVTTPKPSKKDSSNDAASAKKKDKASDTPSTVDLSDSDVDMITAVGKREAKKERTPNATTKSKATAKRKKETIPEPSQKKPDKNPAKKRVGKDVEVCEKKTAAPKTKKRRVIEDSDEEFEFESSVEDNTEEEAYSPEQDEDADEELEECVESDEEEEPPSKKKRSIKAPTEKKRSVKAPAEKKATEEKAKEVKKVNQEASAEKQPLTKKQPLMKKKPVKKEGRHLAKGWSFLSGSFKKATPSKRKPAAKGLQSSAPQGIRKTVKQAYTEGDDLPTISHPQAMFDDMVTNQLTCNGNDAHILKPLLKKLRDRPIRVATMCSGTESPVLALDMLSNSIEDFIHTHLDDEKDELGSLQIEHVFSCEIEPFKQAYIERNFQPPLLFRDIRELGNIKASTAYGSLEDVPNTPGCVDMLVAGTSCVDYSNLNNEKKEIEDKGESGQTFRGMMEWVEKAQPPIVILENVVSAPWDKKVKMFEDRGYHAASILVDTKKYYIPHTRQRGYLFAVKKNKNSKKTINSRTAEEWKNYLKKLQRPASAALDAFMLPNDDPRVLRGRARLSAGRRAESSNGRVDWGKCESRHQYARATEELGEKRPLTGWSDSGNTTMPSFAWNEWMNAQVHRIHDLCDINTLRLAKEGVDCTYKTMVWNLSQNVDRDTMGKLGLCQCLTPTGVPYVTNRGGPLVGEELLLLQGIPADDLLLTKEAEEQLKDLAGNAMSTTVVGACMLSALVLGYDALLSRSTEKGSCTEAAVVPSLVPRPLAPATDEVKIVRDMGTYTEAPLSLGPMVEKFRNTTASQFFFEADSSARKCLSEGYDKSIPSSSILQCQECGQTSSVAFATPPRKYEEHVFLPMKDAEKERVEPAVFRKKLLQVLLMRFELQGIDPESVSMPNGIKEEFWESWKAAVSAATTSDSNGRESLVEFRFCQVTRSNIWTAHYTGGDNSKLELRISRTGALWLLFAKAPAERGTLRDALESPVARMRVKNDKGSGGPISLLNGTWELCVPTVTQVDLNVVGSGSKVDSWESKLGLKGGFEDGYRYEKLEISLKSKAHDELNKMICGVYKLLPRCGGACGSLHKRVQSQDDAEKKNDDEMYLFLESGRCSIGSEDSYVFSNSRARTEYGEYREIVLSVDSSFRPVFSKNSAMESDENLVRAFIPGQWVTTDASIKLISDNDSTSKKLSRVISPSDETHLVVSMSSGGWNRIPEILTCDIPMSSDDKLYQQCSRGQTRNSAVSTSMEVNLQKSNFLFKSLAFVTSRLSIPKIVSETWLPLDCASVQGIEGEPCPKCSPLKPHVKWSVVTKGGRKQYVPIEDGKEASIYEQALKKRPHPWKVHLCAVQGKEDLESSARTVQLRIACNAVSLANRALGLFPQSLARECAKSAGESICFDWRVVPHVDKQSGSFPKLRFTSNKKTPGAQQPPNFKKYNLRPEQLRSLSWMLAQEASDDAFFEEEVTESILPNMSWRAEGRARRPVLVRGGIVADEVGYGKTAITLGLIDAAPTVNGAPPDPPENLQNGLVPTHATLVIVPSHLMGQWPNEIKKFLGGSKRVVEIKDMAGLNKLTIEDVLHADIVICNFTLLTNDKYYSRLARLAGANPNSLPRGGRTGGKHFNAVYNEFLSGLAKRVSSIKEDSSCVFGSIEDDADNHSTTEGKAKSSIRLDGKKAVYKKISEEQTKEASASSEGCLSSHRANGKKAAGGGKLERGERDPWKLSTAQVRQNYRKMHCPPLEIFFWNRIVVDEFHYLEEKKDRARVLTLVLGLKSSFRWCLSGTPPHENFTDVQSLAKLLGLHLGVNEVFPGTKLAKRGGSEESGLDRFTELLEIRSIQWHERRHEIAQRFLNRFLRQNIAEIDEIKCEAHLVKLELPPAEKAIYLELETHLKSLDMNKKKALKSKKSTTSDREIRMQKVLEDSDSAEEALLKTCSHFDMSSKAVDAAETCRIIMKLRKKELEECEQLLTDAVVSALRQRDHILQFQPDWEGTTRTEKGEVQDRLSLFLNDVKSRQSVSGGADGDIHDKLIEIVNNSLEAAAKANNDQTAMNGDKTGGKKRKRSSRNNADCNDAELYDMKFKLREHMHTVRSKCKELCGRIRSLRYFQWVCNFQSDITIICCGGGSSCFAQESTSKKVSRDQAGVFSSCGHVGCLNCLQHNADMEKCINPSCHSQVKHAHIVPAASLGTDADSENGGGQYGAKLTAIVDKVQDLVNRGDRVIVFVQFQDLKEKVLEALKESKVKALQVKGTVQSQVKALDVLQKETPDKNDPRVLLLTMDDESSAGVNLTNCNHAVFVHPLLADTQQQYDAYETQAIGRIRRYGQMKTVHIWRYLAADTIDTEIFDERTSEKY